jgi:hypothetical protein
MVLHVISIISLLLGGLCTLIITVDILSGHQQEMMIMNFVYPITALYAAPLALILYYTIGKTPGDKNMTMKDCDSMNKEKKPFWQSVLIGTLHCGSGCTLGDIVAEMVLFFVPGIFFGRSLAGAWIIDFIFAFIIGIIFQYYAIKPMKKISTKDALKAALKADTLSLIFWQIGMYGWMAITFFLIFGYKLTANDPLFWFMMQIAMLVGFLTSYPINWYLLKKGIKEVM